MPPLPCAQIVHFWVRRFAFTLMSLGVVIFRIRPPWARAAITARSANEPSA